MLADADNFVPVIFVPVIFVPVIVAARVPQAGVLTPFGRAVHTLNKVTVALVLTFRL